MEACACQLNSNNMFVLETPVDRQLLSGMKTNFMSWVWNSLRLEQVYKLYSSHCKKNTGERGKIEIPLSL